MMARLLESGATALGRNAIAAELDCRQVRVVVRALDAGRGVRLADFQISDDLALLVVEPAQERSRSEQTPKTAIGKRRQSTGN
jgi:hypothetical protein